MKTLSKILSMFFAKKKRLKWYRQVSFSFGYAIVGYLNNIPMFLIYQDNEEKYIFKLRDFLGRNLGNGSLISCKKQAEKLLGL